MLIEELVNTNLKIKKYPNFSRNCLLKPRYFNKKLDNFEINVKNWHENTSHYTLLTFFDLVLFSNYSFYPFLSTENYIGHVGMTSYR